MTAGPRRLVNRPLLWGPLLGVIVFALVWWFAWMAPEQAKLSSVRSQRDTDLSAIAALQTRLSALRADQRREQQSQAFLSKFSSAIPPTPEAPDLVVEIYRLAMRDDVKLEGITDDTVVSTTAGYSTIPVSMNVSGSPSGLVAFVSGLYDLPRLITIQQLQLSGAGAENVIAASGQGQVSAVISASAFTTAVGAAATAQGSALATSSAN